MSPSDHERLVAAAFLALGAEAFFRLPGMNEMSYGYLELINDVTSVTDVVEDLRLQRFQNMAAKGVDPPGVFEYEVTNTVGYRLAEQLLLAAPTKYVGPLDKLAAEITNEVMDEEGYVC